LDLNTAAKKFYNRPSAVVVAGYTVVNMEAMRLSETKYPIAELLLQADFDNSGNIYIGPAGVTISSFPLDAGDSISIELNDLSGIYFNSDAAGQTFRYIATY